MRAQQKIMLAAVAAVIGVTAGATSAHAQTVVNLSNLDATQLGASPTTAVNSSTNLDLLNSSTALSNGGLFGGAVSILPGQQATNQVNTLGITATGGVSPVVLGNQSGVATTTPTVTINEITSAYNASGLGGGEGLGSVNGSTSTTINNVNAAISSGVNNIIGANPSINAAYTGGYGGTAGGAAASGNQVGVNTLNGVGAAFASGTNVSLSQIPGAPSAPTAGALGSSIIQGGAVNSSVVNTLLAYTAAGTASVNGASLGSSGAVTGSGSQTAINTFNTATLLGDNLSVATQQKADGLNSLNSTTTSVNRALAFSSGNTLANVDPSVSNLGQTASSTVNSLNLQGISTGTGAASLSGIQSVGNNTVGVGGSGPSTILTNQAVASTIDAGGVVPTVGGNLSSWTGFATSVGATGAPVPSSYTNSNQLNADGVWGSGSAGAGVGSVALSNLSQGTSLTNNTVSAGTSTTPVNVTFGATGFTQNSGQLGLATNPYGTNGAEASTNVGSASIAGLTQSLTQAGNTFSGTGNVSGTLTQSATGLNFASGTVTSPQVTGGTNVVPNGGSGNLEGVVTPNSGPYVINSASASPVLNSASTYSTYGAQSLSGVAQTGNSYTNILAAGGTVDTNGAAGTNAGMITQTLGTLSNYGVAGTALNSQSAYSESSGSNTISNASQGLSLYGNAITGATGVNGSIGQTTQSAGNIGSPTNALSNYNYLGTSTVATASQSNAVSLNSIASSGALGSSTSPAGFSQTSGGATFALGSTSTPSNIVTLGTSYGAGASAAGSNLSQSAAFNMNSISGVGITGNATQVSNGQTSSIGNVVTSNAAYTNNGTPGIYGVMSGNSTLSNVAQGASQSLNSMALNGGAGNGILNQATLGAVTQNTGNIVRNAANSGFATVTGTQVASNAVNVIH